MSNELSQKEINERVAVLKRFKKLLQEQRNKFNEYLVVLETQQRSIAEENIDAIVQHTELEQEIIGDIFTIQKVIDPIEKMYKFSQPQKNDNEVIKLKNDLDSLQEQVLDQNKKNRELLQNRMGNLRKQIVSLNPKFAYSSKKTYAEASSSLVDISV